MRNVALLLLLATLLGACGSPDQAKHGESTANLSSPAVATASATAIAAASPPATIALKPSPATRVSSPTPTTTSTIPTSDSDAVFNAWEHPTSGAPFEIEGYQLAGRAGRPTTPNTPADVLALANGTTLVADTGLGRVLAFDAAGETLPDWGTVAAAGLPIRLASDPAGHVYVLSTTGAVQRLNSDGVPDPEWGLDWGGGPGILPPDLDLMSGLAVDSQDNVYLSSVYIGSSVDSLLVQFDPAGQLALGWALDERCADADVAVDRLDRVYLACRDGIRILGEGGPLADAEGYLDEHILGQTIPFWSGSGDLADKTARPESVAIGPDGVINVLHSGGYATPAPGAHTVYHDWQILRLNADGTLLNQWRIPALTEAYYTIPPSIAIDASGQVLAPDPGGRSVTIFATDGSVVHEITDGGAGTFTRVDRLAIGPDGNAYVLDRSARTVTRITPAGEIVAVISIPPFGPADQQYATSGFSPMEGDEWDLAITADGAICVLEKFPGAFLRLSPTGELLAKLDFNEGRLSNPHNATSMALTQNGLAFTLDTNGGDIEVVDAASARSRGGWDIDLPLETFFIGSDISIAGDIVYLTGYENYHDGVSDLPTIRRFDMHGADLGRVVAFAHDDTVGEGPVWITTDAAGNVYTVTQRNTATAAAEGDDWAFDATFMLRVFDSHGMLLRSGQLGAFGNAYPDLAVSPDGARLYISDPVGRQLLIYDRTEP